MKFIRVPSWLNLLRNHGFQKLAQFCRDYADSKKAENIVLLDVRDLSSVTDYFVIASGSSEPHLRAIVSAITDCLREEHFCGTLRHFLFCCSACGASGPRWYCKSKGFCGNQRLRFAMFKQGKLLKN